MSAFTAPLPRKSSRTSTQAISVPVSAASACGPVTTSKNSDTPPSSDFTATAVSGSRTMMLRYVIATPRPSAAPPGTPRGATRERGDGPGDGRGPAVSSLGGADAKVLLDAGHDARVLVEELVGHRVPATDLLDREELLRGGELVRTRGALHHRPVALRREDALRLRGVQELDEGSGLVAPVLRGGDRVLDQDRLRRDRVVEVLAGLLSRDRLVLVREQHVALAAGEGSERVARALVLHRDVVEQLL